MTLFPAYLASQSLLGRYCEAVLRFDLDLFASCWTGSAEWSIPGEGLISGREAIIRTFADLRSTYQQCMQHVVGSAIDVSARGAAKAVTQVREVQWRRDGSASELMGVYHDDITVVAPGEARYWRRDFELIYSGEASLPGKLHGMPPRGRGVSEVWHERPQQDRTGE